MNGKTPISALQELMAARTVPLPVYVEEGGGISGTPFKCTVRAGGVTAVGFGSSKKSAKHESAKKALEKLGAAGKSPDIMIIERPVTPVSLFRNYIGDLNEWASKYGERYPVYETATVTVTGEFFFKCCFMDKITFGKGLNKKDAKQDAAREMLEQVKKEKPAIKKLVFEKSTIQVKDEENEKIIELYKRLSVTEPKLQVPKTTPITRTTIIEPIPGIHLIDKDNTESLKKKLAEYGVQYSLNEFQRSPYIMLAQIPGTDLHFMAADTNRDEAVRKVLLQILEVKENGGSLTNDLISFN